MTDFTHPIFATIVVEGRAREMTYGTLRTRLASGFGLRIHTLGLGTQLGALAALLDRVSERSGIVIPPLTVCVINTRGEPSFGILPVMTIWMRRRPGTTPSALRDLERLRYGEEPPAYIVTLARREAQAFDWSVVPPLLHEGEWQAAPPSHANQPPPV